MSINTVKNNDDIWLDVETVAKLKGITERGVRLSLSKKYDYKEEIIKGKKIYKIRLNSLEKCGIKTREIKKDELHLFKDIMQHTSDRREFVDRPLSYYENMWDNLYESGILKILVAEIDFNEYEKNTYEELETNKSELNDRINKKEKNILKMNDKKYEQSNKQNKDAIERLEKQLEKINELKKEHGEKTLLGGILFLIYGNEVLSSIYKKHQKN